MVCINYGEIYITQGRGTKMLKSLTSVLHLQRSLCLHHTLWSFFHSSWHLFICHQHRKTTHSLTRFFGLLVGWLMEYYNLYLIFVMVIWLLWRCCRCEQAQHTQALCWFNVGPPSPLNWARNIYSYGIVIFLSFKLASIYLPSTQNKYYLYVSHNHH